MSTALLVITDGRADYLARTVASARDNLRGDITERWMFDDSGDDEHRAQLAADYPEFVHLNAGSRQGFGGAISAAWQALAASSRADHVFHLEADFEFRRPVDVDDLAGLLTDRPHLAQVALRRQAWNAVERAAGGYVEANPDDFVEHCDGDRVWLEHRRFFTTNPSLYRRALTGAGWPAGAQSEGRFGFQLSGQGLPWGVHGAAIRYGLWGGVDSGREWVWHIGDHRAGTGY